MRWSSILLPLIASYVVCYRRTAAIVVSANNFAHNSEFAALLPCGPSINNSNDSAQFDEGFQRTDDDDDDNSTGLDNITTELDNTTGFSSANKLPRQRITLSPRLFTADASKFVAKLALARRKGNETDANSSALSTPTSPSTSLVSNGKVADTLPPSTSVTAPASLAERSLQADLQTSGGFSLFIDSISRDSLSRTVKIILGVVFASMILLVGVGLFEHHSRPNAEATDTNSQVRQWVRSLPSLSGDDVQKQFKSKSGYDCLHHQPQSIPGPVRLEGHVVAMPHSVLKAPLAQRNCVLFSASASAVRLDGVRAPPAAFYAMNSDFELDVAVASGTLRIRVRGVDVALFDVASGWQRERTTWAGAPEHLQDFLHAHRANGSGTLDIEEELDFTECRLDVGAYVTCVGELRREPTGEIGLWPCQDAEVAPTSASFSTDSIEKATGAALGLTSWELLTPRTSPRMGKVMISDEPSLIRQSKPSFCSGLFGLFCWMRSRSDRLRRARL
mmetsp:Transcript_91791/g.145154  ORF Transcript_91791/g.145154 Transcript_91791/m.145154 type:complete len:504 (-) Transcript_91791:105-1616(-)